MFDLNKLNSHRENMYIEAKKAIGGLPHSIWETCSAFANTDGGIVLLGVLENKTDKTLYAVGVPDASILIEDFFAGLYDRRVISEMYLPEENVYPAVVDGKNVVVIEIPASPDFLRPVYINGNPKSAYYRSGESDLLIPRGKQNK